MGHYKLTERFTSRDGKLEPDPRQFGMTEHGLDVIGAAKDQLGGATQIFARVDGGPNRAVDYFTRDNKLNFVRDPKPESGWSVWDLTHDSAGYNPDKGEVGWWNAKVDGADSEIAENIGLPYSWHVSTFLVFTWTEEDIDSSQHTHDDGNEGPQIPTPPTEPDTKTVFATLYTDGTWVKA